MFFGSGSEISGYSMSFAVREHGAQNLVRKADSKLRVGRFCFKGRSTVATPPTPPPPPGYLPVAGGRRVGPNGIVWRAAVRHLGSRKSLKELKLI